MAKPPTSPAPQTAVPETFHAHPDPEHKQSLVNAQTRLIRDQARVINDLWELLRLKHNHNGNGGD